MQDYQIEKIMKSSIWTSDQMSVQVTDNNGNTYVSGVTDTARRRYIENFIKWNHIFKNIITMIRNYTDANPEPYLDENYRKQIKKELLKLEEIKFETINDKGVKSKSNFLGGSQKIVQPSYFYMKSGTKLFRYTDDPVNHIYANPHPLNYGRFTEPGKPGTFYLAFDKKVARDEVAGSNSNKLVKFEIVRDVRALIIPGSLPVFVPEDKFFETKLKKFHNLIFSLTPESDYFESIKEEKRNRLKQGIYIVTNILFKIIKDNTTNIIVYPSTKVKENSDLGRIENNKYFIPNRKNADIAIINDVNYDKDGNAFSKYVRIVR